MSSYFLNSFSGRYPNGSDYQLLNYGTNGAMNASYRDSTSMHSGSFGYNYNGIDLSVNRPNNGHFGAVGDNSRSFQNPGQETRYRQSSCSLSSPDPMSCATSESLELKGSSPPSDQSTPTGNSRLTNSNNLTSSNSTHFADTDETNVSSETEEGAQTTTNTRTQKQESVATSTTTPNDGQTPQIFPWMRKLHISHGIHISVLFLFRHAQMKIVKPCFDDNSLLKKFNYAWIKCMFFSSDFFKLPYSFRTNVCLTKHNNPLTDH